MTTGEEGYIVRIYRRDPENPERVTGTLECAGSQESRVFHSAAELLQLLELERRAAPTGAGAGAGAQVG